MLPIKPTAWIVVSLCVMRPHWARGAERLDTSPPQTATSPKPAAYPWKLDTEHRFLWLHKSEPIGETRFLVRVVPFPGRPGKRLYEVTATRSYQRQGVVQQASSTTLVSLDGEPQHFEEQLTVLHATAAHRTRQTTKFERRGEFGRMTYIQNDRKEVVREQRLPEGTFLSASQAVEHWVLFVASLPEAFGDRTVKLFYPDHRKIFDVQLTRKAAETVSVGNRKIPARRYAFRSTQDALSGHLWIGADRRLVQIEFPHTQVKVVRASD